MFHYRAYELNIASEIEFPELEGRAAGTGIPDVVVSVLEALPSLPDATHSDAWWQVSPSAFRMEVKDIAVYQVEEGRRIFVDPAHSADPAEVRVFLLGSAMGALLYQRGIFSLHGSAVETPWGAMVFVGPSGIGKSTLAAHFHRAGQRLIADDVCAIARDGGGRLQVLPAFPHLRLKSDAVDRLYGAGSSAPPSRFDVDKFVLPLGEGHASAPVPLGIVHLLMDADSGDPTLVALRGFESIQALADNLYRPYFLQGMQTRGEVLRLAGEIARSAEVVQLSRRRDAAHLDTLVRWLEHGWEGWSRPSKSLEP
ncbi:MAG: hypothetical protein IPQ13_06130 [Holophagaceae bacterium]|nr:hypothetical protein [Holophagaceae bacterium]